MGKVKQKALAEGEPCTGYSDCEYLEDGLCTIWDLDDCPQDD
jgi:hypothetical protein